MSTDLIYLRSSPGTEASSDRRERTSPTEAGSTPIGRQSREIIETILADPDPELAEVRQRLRKHVAAHPGFPEQALLGHLLETGQRNSSGPDRPGPDDAQPIAMGRTRHSFRS